MTQRIETNKSILYIKIYKGYKYNLIFNLPKYIGIIKFKNRRLKKK